MFQVPAPLPLFSGSSCAARGDDKRQWRISLRARRGQGLQRTHIDCDQRPSGAEQPHSEEQLELKCAWHGVRVCSCFKVSLSPPAIARRSQGGSTSGRLSGGIATSGVQRWGMHLPLTIPPEMEHQSAREKKTNHDDRGQGVARCPLRKTTG